MLQAVDPSDSLEQLGAVDQTLVARFKGLCHQLEAASFTVDADNIEVTWKQHQIVSEQLVDVVTEIRRLSPVFEYFLRRIPYSDLQLASKKGPCVLVNISSDRSDAIVLLEPEKAPIVVPLAQDLSGHIPSLLSELGAAGLLGSSGGIISDGDSTVLRKLWMLVVEPVVQMLMKGHVPEGTHVWWCAGDQPCASLLDAVWAYAPDQKNQSHVYPSSCILNLAALI